MKQTMLAIMAAVGVTFCSKAEVLNATGFENYGDNVTNVVNYTDQGGTVGEVFWTGDGNAIVAEVMAYGEDDEKPVEVPAAFAGGEENGKYLTIDAGNSVLSRRITADGGEPYPISGESSVYLDMDVKFTVSDTNSVEYSEGDKLVVWLYGDEEGNTNLMVKAAKRFDPLGEVEEEDFVIDNVSVNPDNWYRLTVKAEVVEDERYAGTPKTVFGIYIDGTLISASGTSSFISMVQSGVDAQTIQGAGFQGAGSLDNVVWTTDDPFRVDTFTVNATLTDEESQVGEWTLNGVDATGLSEASAGVVVGADAEIVATITVYTPVTVTATVGGVNVASENITSAPGEDESTVYTITVDGSSYVDGDAVALAITVVAAEEPGLIDLSGATVTLSADSITVGDPCPTVTSVVLDGAPLTERTDYTVDYGRYTTESAAGTYTVTVTGTGAYTGMATATFTVNPAPINLSGATVTLSAATITVGDACPTVTSVVLNGTTLTERTDYTVDYGGYTTESAAGTYIVTVTGTGDYTGTVTATFTVEAAAEPETVVTPTSEEITAGEITVVAETTAIKLGDIEVPIENFNVAEGKATVKVPVIAPVVNPGTGEEEEAAVVVEDDSVTVNVNPVEGLFYGVAAAANLDALARPAKLTQYTGENKDIFTADKPNAAKGFFRVYVDIKE